MERRDNCPPSSESTLGRKPDNDICPLGTGQPDLKTIDTSEGGERETRLLW